MRAILDGVFYALASYGTTILGTAASFLVRLWVPPAVFGATSIVNAVQGYFGTYNGLYRNAIDREVPVHLGNGDKEGADNVLRACYTLLLISAFVESVIFVGIGLFSKDFYLRLAWWVTAFVNLTNTFSTTDRITLKASVRFHEHNAALSLGAFVNASVLVGLSWLWDYRGYFAALVAGSIVQFIIFRRVLNQGWRGYLSFPLKSSVVKRVLSIGVFIGIFNLAAQLLLTVDRYFVVGFLSLTDLGYYSLGSMMMVRVYTLPKTLIGSYMPRMMALLGGGRIEHARYVADKLQRSSVLVSACISGALLLLIRPLISWALPEYVGAIPAIQIMVWGCYFLGARAVTQQLHIGLERMGQAILITVLGVLVAVGLNFALVRYGLTGVALATNVAIGLYVLMMNRSGERILQMRGLNRWFFVGTVLLAVLYTVSHFVGLGAALTWLVIYSIASAWYLTRLYQIKWCEMPNIVRSYLSTKSVQL